MILRGYDDWYIDDEAIDNDGDATVGDSRAADGGDDKDNRVFFATCIPGLEQALAGELVEIGARRVQTEGKSGVRFEGSPVVGLKALVYSRTMHKLMELVASSAVHQPEEGGDDFGYQDDFSRGIRTSRDLYDFVQSAAHAPSLLGDGKGGLLTMSVGTIYSGKPPKELSHTHYTALTVKNAIVDLVRELRDDGERPDVDIVSPDVPLVLFIKARSQFRSRNWRDEREEEVDIVADVDLYRCLHSGGSLHKRGYRVDDSGDATAPIHRAAMKESLAAGLLLEAGWGKLINDARGNGRGAVLLDPMTGSATFPVEAALIAGDVAPALVRIASWRGRGPNPNARPSCLKWKDFASEESWNELLEGATRRAKAGLQWAQSETAGGRPNVNILCNERNPGAADLAASSIKKAGVNSMISLVQGDCIDWHLEDGEVIEGRTMVVSNPPWGIRLTEDIDESWVNLREFLRREAGGTEAWILSGNSGRWCGCGLRTAKQFTNLFSNVEKNRNFLPQH